MRRVYRNDEAEPISEEKQKSRLFRKPTDYTQITDAGTVAALMKVPAACCGDLHSKHSDINNAS